MKLILQHGPQQVEFEFMTEDDLPLTTQQATRAIDLAYDRWKRSFENLPGDPTTVQKAQLLLRLMADHLMSAARQQWNIGREEKNASDRKTELG